MSVIKHKNQRVGIFIDTQNLYHCAKNIYGAKVNFDQVVKDGLAGRSLTRAVAYVITTEAGDEKNFFEALEKMGIETKTKNLQIFAGGSKKADWDVGMAVDAVKLAEKVDVLVLLTGDGDFVPLVEYLHGRGVIVEVAAFAESTNAQLKAIADRFFDISTDGRECLIGAHRMYRQPFAGKAPMGSPQTETQAAVPSLEELAELGPESAPTHPTQKKGRGRPRGKKLEKTTEEIDLGSEDDEPGSRPIRVTF
jgi:uncharacterized LabA/DUF88 family protein